MPTTLEDLARQEGQVPGLARLLTARNALQDSALRAQQAQIQQQFLKNLSNLPASPTVSQMEDIGTRAVTDPKSLVDLAQKRRELIPLTTGGLIRPSTGETFAPYASERPAAIHIIADDKSPTGFSYQDFNSGATRPGAPPPKEGVDNPSVHIVQDKASPTGWSYENFKNGERKVGAPPPASGQLIPGQNPLGNDPNFWYEYYDKTKTLPPMAWGQAGNPTREAFLRGFPEWKKAQPGGSTASDTASNQAQFRANSAAMNRVTIDLNSFEPYKKMLDTNVDIAIQLGRKIHQNAPALVNRPVNWLIQNAGSNPDVAEYLAQMRFVQTEAARVINNPRIVGQLTDQSRREIDGVISGNAPIPVVERVLNRLKIDGTNRFNAMRQQQREIIGSMRGTSPQTGIPEFATETEAAQAGLAPGTKIKIGGKTGTWQ